MIDEDGGITKTVNVNAPKIIKSTQIVIFECKFSTFAFLDSDEEIGNRVYNESHTQTYDCRNSSKGITAANDLSFGDW